MREIYKYWTNAREIDEGSSCNIAYYGECGTPITPFLLHIMLGDYGKAIQNS